ncbi:MAG: EAL domain-containing protein [Nocardioidaceae bacterium]|nr:EAL domain-containing protein [Nocardioidaceae bacterium]
MTTAQRIDESGVFAADPEPAPRPAHARLGRVFDVSVAVSGGAIGVAAAVWLSSDLSQVWIGLFLCVPVIMVLGWFPVLLAQQRTGGMEIGMDVCVLIFLATTTTFVQALTVWSIGTFLAQSFRRKPRLTRAFNAGIGIIAGAVALLATEVAPSGNMTDPRQLLAMAIGATVYFITDVSVTSISLSMEHSTALLLELRPMGALTALATSLATSSLGYLAALVVPALPRWAAVLVAVPVATTVIASRAQTRGAEHARRLKVLLETAMKVHILHDRPALLVAVRRAATELMRDSRVRLDKAAPPPGEIGVAVHDPGGDFWIVGPARMRSQSSASDDENGLAALAAVAEDALARLHLSEAMTFLAWHDPLTGLANRAFFMNRVQLAIERRTPQGARAAVLFCDLDGFKRVNDLFGHSAGDELLAEVGRRIRTSVRQEDTVARLGGDEFAVLMESVDEPKEIQTLCERIMAALREPVHLIGGNVFVTTSIGIAWSSEGASSDALLSRADLAMYYAKGRGKDQFATYDANFGEERRQRLELVEKLRYALSARELEVFYQPLFDLGTREVFGVEALVRWRRGGELIPPDLFVPTAEESGLIVDLGELVLDRVIADAPQLRAAAGKTLSIGINLPAKHLQVKGFVERVTAARALMGDVHLILEMTERDFINHDPTTLATMTALAAADIRLAIDDFGVGFSSIGYLQRLPVRILKIDKSFTAHIDDDPRACSLMRSIVLMGKALGLDVIVEGIERESQLTHLTTHTDASTGQGYLFAHPMSATDLVTFLSAKRASSLVATHLLPSFPPPPRFERGYR